MFRFAISSIAVPSVCQSVCQTVVCMYVCMVIYVRATAYSLDCHVRAMINRRLYRTFQSLVVHRIAAVTSTGRELSVSVCDVGAPYSAG